MIYNDKKFLQDETFSIQIPANGMVEYNESKNNDKSFYIFKTDNNGWIKDSLDTFNFIQFKSKNYETE